MAFFIGRDREARRAYGFDEIALVPGDVTVNPDEVDTTLKLGNVHLEIPFLASAMDGVVDTEFAIAMGKLGGLGVLNLDGINTRYEKPREVVMQIAGASPEEATRLVQDLYRPAVKEESPPFRRTRKNTARSPWRRAPTSSSCSPPSPRCDTRPPSTSPSTSRPSARR
jgi:IMP dehydrogenase